MNDIFLTVSPLLRGLTFDGERGHYVVVEDDPGVVGFAVKPENSAKIISRLSFAGKTEKCGCIPLYIEKTENIDRLEKELVEKMRDYDKQYGCFPHIVVVEDTAVFTVAKTFSEAKTVLESLTDRRSGDLTGPSSDREDDRPTKSAILKRARVVQDKIAVVTGGVQGFGEAIVRNLVEAGAFVFIADINEEGVKKRSAELNTKYQRTVTLPIVVNIADEDSVKSMIRAVVRQAGGVDIFIANAGVLRAGSVKTLSFADFEFVTKVNYMGYFLCTKHVSPVLALQNRPSGEYFTDIIQINSKSGLVGSNKNSAYAGSKFGGIGLTQSFAMELVEDNIKVNSICPGNYFEGPLWSDPENGLFVQYYKAGKVPGAQSPADVKKYYESKVLMGRGCDGKDIMKTIYYLIEQDYETGQAVPVTGGQVMLR